MLKNVELSNFIPHHMTKLLAGNELLASRCLLNIEAKLGFLTCS